MSQKTNEGRCPDKKFQCARDAKESFKQNNSTPKLMRNQDVVRSGLANHKKGQVVESVH